MTRPRPIPWHLPGFADELALASSSSRMWIAASTSTMSTEEVWAGEITPAGVSGAFRIADEPCCRPAITVVDDRHALVVACTATRAIVGALASSERVVRWRTRVDGDPRHLACVTAAGTTWIAIEIATHGERRIAWCAIDPATGVLETRAILGDSATWCRWPALVASEQPILAWCQGPPRSTGAIHVSRWTGALAGAPVSEGPGEAPALALAGGRVAVAWHVGGPSLSGSERDASVVREIDVSILEPDGSRTAARPPLGAGGVDARGEDQGWELPALAFDEAGALWLAGRSTHGHHVACRDANGRWTGPHSLCNGAWGGRGRRHALAAFDGTMWLARREPDGVTLAACERPRSIAAPAVTRVHRAARTPPVTQGILFGDLHQHTAHSDGCGSFEDLWIAARDRRGLDFAAITDHDQFCRRALGPATWQLACQIANEFDEPGRFVAIHGYELTGPRHPGPGHKCIYFANRVPDRVPDRELTSLFALLRELGGIAVPHHVGWTGGDFSHHAPDVQPVWELCSVHGCYESADGCAAHPPRGDHVIPGQFIRDALAAGLRFGFIGSTDSHGLDWHHGIARWRNPFRAGLACLVDAEPTREGIIAAMRARRAYGTSGARIGLRVRLDGAPMGSDVASTGGELVVEIQPTAPIARVVLVDHEGETDIAFETDGTIVRARSRAPATTPYLYVRVEQADNELAWSSPFWQRTEENP
ncbi:MAG: CehA/McbA family metallohydrolase [Kofleriaceae bacterium]